MAENLDGSDGKEHDPFDFTHIHVDYSSGRTLIGDEALEEASQGTLMGDYGFDDPPTDAANPNIKPLGDALADPHFPPADMPVAKPRRDWTEGDLTFTGMQAVKHIREHNALTGDDARATMSVGNIKKLYAVGLLPSEGFIRRRFGNRTKYQETTGGDPHDRDPRPYRQWSDEEWRRYAEKVDEVAAVHPPRYDDYEIAGRTLDGPSGKGILNVFGSHHELNELIGYPNHSNWNKQEILDWGEVVATVNGIDRVTATLIDKISGRGFGPSATRLKSLFPLGIPGFRDEIRQRIEGRQGETTTTDDDDERLTPDDYRDKLIVTNDELGIKRPRWHNEEPWKSAVSGGGEASIGAVRAEIYNAIEGLEQSLSQIQQALFEVEHASQLFRTATTGLRYAHLSKPYLHYEISLEMLHELQHQIQTSIDRYRSIADRM